MSRTLPASWRSYDLVVSASLLAVLPRSRFAISLSGATSSRRVTEELAPAGVRPLEPGNFTITWPLDADPSGSPEVPVTYQIDQESRLIRTRCIGDVSLAEVLGHFRQLERDATLPERLDVLLDLTEMGSIPESDQLRSVAREVERLQQRLEWGSCAIVASRDVLFGMSRMFQVFAEASFASSNVFRELDQAERWLASQHGSTG